MARPADELEAQLRAAFTPLAATGTARARTIVALVFLKRVSDEHQSEATPSQRVRMVEGCSFADVLGAPTPDKLVDALARLVAANRLPVTIAIDLSVDEKLLGRAMTSLAKIDLAPARVPVATLIQACDGLLDGAETPWRALLHVLYRLEANAGDGAPLEDTLLHRGPPPSPPPQLPAASLARGSMLSRYLVLDLLGRGGWGEVYSAFDPELDRKIAIKVMRPETAAETRDTEGRARLLREAQAMARLQHPNVIAVHDVGLLPPSAGVRDERLFIAMELVDGVTLRQWLEDAPRTWRQLLDMFIQAGRGLAAAHAAGLIHRDFKPDNVLVGKDGRARVLDFGLVRSEGVSEGSEATPEATIEATLEAALRAGAIESPLSTPLTRTGALMGTPMYMSPEQMTGGHTDARTDQFSFCVALYRALYGVHPFAGDSMQRMLVEVHSARIQAPARDRGVPSWLRPLVTRGLKLQAGERFASMDALLAALAHDPRVARRRWLVTGGVIALVAAGSAGVTVLQRERRALCQGGAARLDGVWDDARRRAVEQAFVATGRPYAAAALASLAHGLDGFAHDFAAMFEDACAATRLRGEQSEELLDLRMQCLGHQLEEVKAATELFSHADGRLVENAAKAAAALPQVSDCADVAALKAPVRPPSDPGVRARVEKVRGELAHARAALDASKWGDGLPIARGAVDAAQQLAYQPLVAEALVTLGQLERESGDTTAARPHLIDAALTAEASHADNTAAQAWTQRVMLAYDESKLPEGDDVMRWAQAAVARTGDERLLATLDNAVGALMVEEGKYDEAMRRYQHTLALRRKLPATPPLLIASVISNIGNVYLKSAHYNDAIGAYQEALGLKLRAVGKDHPSVAATLNNLGNAYGDQRRFDEALDSYRRALAVWRVALGPKHRDVSMCLGNIGATLADMGRYQEAVAADREVLALDEAALGPDHPDVAVTLCNLGRALVDAGKADEARPLLERARRIQEKSIGTAHVDYAHTLSALAKVHEARGEHALALGLGQRSLAIREAALHGDSPSAPTLTTVGEALLGLNRAREAQPLLEKALATLQAETAPNPLELANVRFDLARALWDGGGDRGRARTLAQAARDAAGQRDRARVVEWLAARAPSGEGHE
jgi:tetratricopeptide (TPR) repeat protein